MVTGDVKRWQAGLIGAVVSPRRADSGLPGERGIFQLMSVSGKKRPPGYCGTDWPESPNRYVEDRLAPQEGAKAPTKGLGHFCLCPATTEPASDDRIRTRALLPSRLPGPRPRMLAHRKSCWSP